MGNSNSSKCQLVTEKFKNCGHSNCLFHLSTGELSKSSLVSCKASAQCHHRLKIPPRTVRRASPCGIHDDYVASSSSLAVDCGALCLKQATAAPKTLYLHLVVPPGTVESVFQPSLERMHFPTQCQKNFCPCVRKLSFPVTVSFPNVLREDAFSDVAKTVEAIVLRGCQASKTWAPSFGLTKEKSSLQVVPQCFVFQ